MKSTSLYLVDYLRGLKKESLIVSARDRQSVAGELAKVLKTSEFMIESIRCAGPLHKTPQ